tara:strand:- start:9661 stop:9870 length:210 start_codon:yes stop_codon:yes gene_type:complete
MIDRIYQGTLTEELTNIFRGREGFDASSDPDENGRFIVRCSTVAHWEIMQKELREHVEESNVVKTTGDL